jgi:hypothetical protein
VTAASAIGTVTLAFGVAVSAAGGWHNRTEPDAAILAFVLYLAPYGCFWLAWTVSKGVKSPKMLAIASGISGVALVATSAWLYHFHTVTLSHTRSSTAGIAALWITLLQLVVSPLGFAITSRD